MITEYYIGDIKIDEKNFYNRYKELKGKDRKCKDFQIISKFNIQEIVNYLNVIDGDDNYSDDYINWEYVENEKLFYRKIILNMR